MSVVKLFMEIKVLKISTICDSLLFLIHILFEFIVRKWGGVAIESEANFQFVIFLIVEKITIF